MSILLIIFSHGRTSKQVIIIPHAGAILAILGTVPAKSVRAPSVRIICMSNSAFDILLGCVTAMMRACRLVLRTSSGDVMRAAVVPLSDPHKNGIHWPVIPDDANLLFEYS